ncbi:MAG: hypothetical protein NVS3B20_17890 [Polyangiales bacterium]
MTELVRFGVAIDCELLSVFDKRIARKGYENRSEAIRDLIRADLLEDAAVHDGDVTASLTLVYDHHVRELTERLTAIQHDLGHHVISAMHVHLDHDHCLEVIVMKGPALKLQRAANQIVATKGVINGRLTLTGVSTPRHFVKGHSPSSRPVAMGTKPPPLPNARGKAAEQEISVDQEATTGTGEGRRRKPRG